MDSKFVLSMSLLWLLLQSENMTAGSINFLPQAGVALLPNIR